MANSTAVNRLISSMNTTFKDNLTSTTIETTKKPLFFPGQELFNNGFNKVNHNTLVLGTVALATITCLILLYIGIRTFLLRKRRYPRRYKLLGNNTNMEEPLFNGHDDEEERDDDTLFVRK